MQGPRRPSLPCHIPEARGGASDRAPACPRAWRSVTVWASSSVCPSPISQGATEEVMCSGPQNIFLSPSWQAPGCPAAVPSPPCPAAFLNTQNPSSLPTAALPPPDLPLYGSRSRLHPSVSEATANSAQGLGRRLFSRARVTSRKHSHFT